MRAFSRAVLLLSILSISAMAQNLVITPTTTLAAETGNNTSAAGTFTTSSNNNLGAGNISKVATRSLLYADSTTGIYTHWMPWFGTTSHINIGYDSADPAEIKKQVDDMLSRGINGAIVDWYGPNNTHSNTSTLNLMYEANLRNGQFRFAITEDGGALRDCAGSQTCNLTSQIISDLTYAYNTFETSPAYLTLGGRPVVFFFTPDRFGTLDWTRVAASVPGNPIFVFQDRGGFTHPESDGSFSWIYHSSDPNDWGQSALTSFYQTAMTYPSEHTVGSTKKGFNDTMASWGSYRVVNQNCGQTWLNTFGLIPTLYSSSNPLESVQLVTWNDYEEGSEIETGIDNCVFLGSSLSGSILKWDLVGGSEASLDHYTVYISLDAQNLMALKQVPTGTSSLDLSGYALAPGTYTLYVKAVGKPSLSNRMSNPVAYTVGDQPPATTLSVTPTSGSAPLTVSANMTASDSDGVVTATSIDFGDGTVVNGSSATHTYTKPGSYRVVASATDDRGSSSASATLVTATNANPVAMISVTPTSGAAPVAVTASAAGSYDPDGTIANTTIDFGDGTVMSGSSATHTYNGAGSYKVWVTVVDNFGAFGRASSTVSVSGPTVTLTSPANGATLTSPVHVAASATGSRAISSLSIFDNGFLVYTGSGSSVDTYVKVMPDAQHTIKVKATDSAGASGSSSTKIWVNNQAPVAKLSVTPTSGTAPLTVTASTSASSDPDGTIVSSTIDFGDGTVAAGPTASHTYNLAGSYTVKATVSDGLGGYASATQVVTAGTATSTTSGVTVASPLNGSTVSSPVHVVASATSSKPITAMKIYLDYVAVYSVAAAKIDTYLTISTGSHHLTVQAWDSGGTVYKSSLTVNVVAGLTAALSVTPSSGVAPLAVTASTAGSTDSGATITSSSINFGDGTTLAGPTAAHTYTVAGTFTVTATVKDSAGRTATKTATVAVSASTTYGVKVTSPVNGATVSSPVHVVASASSSKPITAMKIYLDYVAVYSVSAANIDTYVKMSSGSHHLTVQAWDSAGTVYKTSLSITVP